MTIQFQRAVPIWGMTEVWVTDPFGNHIRFGEQTEAAAA
jgi:hypothetical protein